MFPGSHMLKIRIGSSGSAALRTVGRIRPQRVSAYRKLRERQCSRYTAGQDELEALCYEYDAEYFPLGCGSGTCLVACASSDPLTELCANVAKSEDGSEGRRPIRATFCFADSRFAHYQDATIPSAGVHGVHIACVTGATTGLTRSTAQAGSRPQLA